MKQCMGCMEIYSDNLTKCPICGYEEGTMPENTLHMEPGAILNNRYIVGKVLGYGGFGVTYIAWDTLLEQKVAIKEFLPSEYATRMLGRLEVTIFSGDKHKQFMEGLMKFIAEAKKIAQFNNVPGIVKIFDCIEENNTAYIIMEYLEGMTLAEKLEKEKRMKPEKAISLLLPVMEALKKVNLNGIIHRDIAPDNIFITSNGEPKLIDFGAARYASTSLSRSLTIIIKPGYSPEEQYRSMGDQGSWTDVYSIGATLYKMITGETPCDSMERKAYMEQNGTDLLKPISKFVNIDKNQENAIMNALNIKIHERTMNMGTLMDELTTDMDVRRLQGSNKKAHNILLDIPLKVKLITLVSVILLVACVSFFGMYKGKEPLIKEGMTRVPNVRNIKIEVAIKKLESCNLKYKITGYTYSTSIPANSVMTQSIKVGETVRINTEIELTVSKVDNAYEMNNVLAMNYVKAAQLLEDSGYTVNLEEDRFDDVIAKDCVVKQDLNKKAGEKTVTIMVSKGREMPYLNEYTDVPKFVGTKFTDCFRMAKSAGLMLEIVERKASKEVKEGEVLTQNIELNTSVKKGTVVKLTVSKGTDEVTIDDFTNWEIEKAREYLTEQGIFIEEEYEVNESYDHGIIFGQSLEPGSKVKTGETLTLKVSIGPEEFQMISLYKKTKEEAIQLLKEYGLEYEVESGYYAGVDENCVYHQSIAKGTQTRVGEKVIIKVRDGNSDMELPNIIGKNINDIENELTDIGFIVETQKEFNGDVESGSIISTTPECGERYKVGTTVTIVYSGGKGDIQSVAEVKNINYTQAETTLKGQGLEVELIFEFHPEKAGTVVSQSIESGQRASTGDKIQLIVSKGPEAQVTFSNNPLTMKENSTTQTYATINADVDNVKWEIINTSIANVNPTSNPSYNDGNNVTQYAVVSAYKKGTTTLIMTIEYIDGTTSEHKCKVIVE